MASGHGKREQMRLQIDIEQQIPCRVKTVQFLCAHANAASSLAIQDAYVNVMLFSASFLLLHRPFFKITVSRAYQTKQSQDCCSLPRGVIKDYATDCQVVVNLPLHQQQQHPKHGIRLQGDDVIRQSTNQRERQ